MGQSLIYNNIFVYRLLMNVLYLGKYNRRFERIIKIIKNSNSTNIIELCFGDTYIAEYCKKNDIHWTGYDLNESFVNRAKKLNHNAILKDITSIDQFNKCDTSIIIGSLYHFKEEAISIIRKMIQSSKQVIISEPIKNLTSSDGIIGFIAKKSTNAGKGNETFRFSKESFIKMIDELKIPYKIISIDKDILIEINNG